MGGENEIKARLELTLIYKNVFVSFSHMGGAATYFAGAAELGKCELVLGVTFNIAYHKSYFFLSYCYIGQP